MNERSIKSAARDRNSRLFQEKTTSSNKERAASHAPDFHVRSFSLPMILTVVSSVIAVAAILGLAIFRYYARASRRRQLAKDSSYSVSRYWRRQLPSTSFDSSTPHPQNRALHQNTEETNETTRIIKSSFSWPEVSLLHKQQQQQQPPPEKGEASSPMSSSSSLSNSSAMEQMVEPASFTFSLRWNETTDSLFVRVISARNLVLPRRQRSSNLFDSYVRIELISTSENEPMPSMRTHIVKKNIHPVYDELFEFPNTHPIDSDPRSLLFTILTYDTFTRDEVLGQVLLPLRQQANQIGSNPFSSNEIIFTREVTSRYVQLSNQQLGQLLISLCYQPMDSTINLTLLKASNLPRLDSTRMINPYFKIYMFYKDQRIMKKRSTIKRTTQSPVYNECFTFHIPDNDIWNIHFDITLFDYDQHMKHEAIGMMTMGTKTNETNQHWTDVCQRQTTKQIAQWYQLKPLKKWNS